MSAQTISPPHPAVAAVTAGKVVSYPNHAAWLASRTERLGASEVADLFGVGYSSEFALWQKFAHPETVDEDDDADEWESERMAWGSRLQSAILDGVADREGWQVIEWPQDCRVDHDAWRLSATPDGIGREPGGQPFLIEVKSLNEFADRDWLKDEDGTPIAPAKFQAQAQAQMACTGLDRCAIVMLLGGQRLAVHWIDRHENFQESLGFAIEDFWRRVRDDDPPAVDGSEQTRRAILAMYPEDVGTGVELGAEFDAIADELAVVGEERRHAEKRERLLKNKMSAAIGDATYAVTATGRAFSLKTQQRKGIDADVLKSEFPETYDKCLKISSTRVLRPVKKLPTGVDFGCGPV